jgi:uncharacterized protein (DUF362 family)
MTVIVKKVESYGDVPNFVRYVLENLNLFENLEVKSIRTLPEKILIKPNFLKWDSGISTTHPEVVRSVAAFLKNSGKKVFIYEGGFTKNVADRYFEKFSLHEFGECFNMNRGEFIEVKVGGKKLKTAKISKKALELLKDSAFFVSLPKLKVHHLSLITIGVKNNMGFLKKPAINMHRKINEKLVDLLNVLNPHLVIVDGIVGGENSESNTVAVNHGVMLAGDNVVEVDAVGAYLMGFDPLDIRFLKIAEDRGFGECDVSRIKVIGDDISGLRRKYSISGIRRMLGRLSI